MFTATSLLGNQIGFELPWPIVSVLPVVFNPGYVNVLVSVSDLSGRKILKLQESLSILL